MRRKIKVFDMNCMSINDIEALPYKWFVFKGNLFVNRQYVADACMIAKNQNAKMLDKDKFIELRKESIKNK